MPRRAGGAVCVLAAWCGAAPPAQETFSAVPWWAARWWTCRDWSVQEHVGWWQSVECLMYVFVPATLTPWTGAVTRGSAINVDYNNDEDSREIVVHNQTSALYRGQVIVSIWYCGDRIGSRWNPATSGAICSWPWIEGQQRQISSGCYHDKCLWINPCLRQSTDYIYLLKVSLELWVKRCTLFCGL